MARTHHELVELWYRLQENWFDVERPPDRIKTAVDVLLHQIDRLNEGYAWVVLFQGKTERFEDVYDEQAYGAFPAIALQVESTEEGKGRLRAFLVGDSRPLIFPYDLEHQHKWGVDWHGIVAAVRHARKNSGTWIGGALERAVDLLKKRLDEVHQEESGIPPGYSQRIVLITDGHNAPPRSLSGSECSVLKEKMKYLRPGEEKPLITLFLIREKIGDDDPLAECLDDRVYDLRRVLVGKSPVNLWPSRCRIDVPAVDVQEGKHDVSYLYVVVEGEFGYAMGEVEVGLEHVDLQIEYRALSGQNSVQLSSCPITGILELIRGEQTTTCRDDGQNTLRGFTSDGETPSQIHLDFSICFPIEKIQEVYEDEVDRLRNVHSSHLWVGHTFLSGDLIVWYRGGNEDVRAEKDIKFQAEFTPPLVHVTVSRDAGDPSQGTVDLALNRAARDLVRQGQGVEVCLQYPSSILCVGEFPPGKPKKLLENKRVKFEVYSDRCRELPVKEGTICVESRTHAVVITGDLCVPIRVAKVDPELTSYGVDLKKPAEISSHQLQARIPILVSAGFTGKLNVSLGKRTLPAGITAEPYDGESLVIDCPVDGSFAQELVLEVEYPDLESLKSLNETDDEIELCLVAKPEEDYYPMDFVDPAICTVLVDLSYMKHWVELEVVDLSEGQKKPGDRIAMLTFRYLARAGEVTLQPSLFGEWGKLLEFVDENGRIYNPSQDKLVADAKGRSYALCLSNVVQDRGDIQGEYSCNLSNWNVDPPGIDVDVEDPCIVEFLVAPPQFPDEMDRSLVSAQEVLPFVAAILALAFVGVLVLIIFRALTEERGGRLQYLRSRWWLIALDVMFLVGAILIWLLLPPPMS